MILKAMGKFHGFFIVRPAGRAPSILAEEKVIGRG
jgi:hypothetical protein